MGPLFTLDDITYLDIADVKILGDAVHTNASGVVSRADSHDLLISEFGARRSFPPTRAQMKVMPFFGGIQAIAASITNILCAGAKIQMVWINTPAMVATMANKQAVRNRTTEQFPRQTVRCFLLLPMKNGIAVTRGTKENGPVPALIGVVYPSVPPEQFPWGLYPLSIVAGN